MNKTNKKVLLIEDDQGIARMICTLLTISKIDFIHADTGAKGLQALANEDIGLVICDIMLPDVLGYDILKHIRTGKGKDKAGSEIYFVFLTAFADPADVQRGLDAGADKYITKPFSASELLGVVREQMQATA